MPKNDSENGFAGDNKVIDAVKVYYNTPHNIVSSQEYQQAQYRSSQMNQGYSNWQYDDETRNGQNGFTGSFGRAIDRFQLF
ncbi:MAG: hypothetical protein HFG81_12805 [Dorea sp.]|jgi:hypothetical protein|uniref:hypothetical protein n=1 Tax=Sporofaciens musculi TaxID=2681861 RepID=UPI00216E804C|nr:hypothetical protein [Sporofaciens musculi]MCI9423567.1 hypothetical protein [Dorea sp.]